jgi:hypothetical protein
MENAGAVWLIPDFPQENPWMDLGDGPTLAIALDLACTHPLRSDTPSLREGGIRGTPAAAPRIRTNHQTAGRTLLISDNTPQIIHHKGRYSSFILLCEGAEFDTICSRHQPQHPGCNQIW